MIASRLREADRIEVEATMRPGDSVTSALFRAYNLSTHRWTGMINNTPIMICGVVPQSVIGQIGIPWLVGTDEITDVKRQFVQECRQYLDKMQAAYPEELVNFVDCRNETSIRWLKWMGFDIEEPVPFGNAGEMFHPFRRAA